jgi:hypothetical protein
LENSHQHSIHITYLWHSIYRSLTRTCPTTSSPAVKATQKKKIFDAALDKTTWHLQPSIIPFLTPMAVLEQVNTNNNAGLRMLTTPVNHNKLDKKKTLQIIYTILGNTYQHENKLTRKIKISD